MKKTLLIASYLIVSMSLNAQDNIDELLAAGITDAQQFTSDYLAPATNGVAYGINSGWFNNAKTPKRFGFELSIIGNASFIKDEQKSFELVVADYQNVRFEDGSASKTVSTALGHNETPIEVIITYDDPIFGEQEETIELPTGLGSEGINFIPTAFLQASFSPFKGTQVKARFFPKLNTDDVDLSVYGFGIQQDFTSFLPADKVIPVAISGLVAYTHLDASFDFTETGIVDGENQQIQTEVNTLLFQLIAGTKLPVINFYGALGYIDGKSTTDLLGVYRVSDGIFTSEDITDPFSVESKTSGVTTTLGTTLKLGFFGLNASYTLAKFDSASLGMNFSF